MALMDVLPAALATLLLGAGLLGLVGLSLRWVAARRRETYVASPVRLPVEPAGEATGIVVAQPGGRILFANSRAREIFGLNGQPPDLWQMARQAQPSDTFLELFITEGRASLSIGERQLEATSVRVPPDDQGPGRIVVMLRDSGLLPVLATGDERSAQAVAAVAEWGQAIHAQPDLAGTLQAVLDSLSRAFPFDLAEITLWDETAQLLRPARYAGEPEYPREIARQEPPGYRLDEGLSGWLATQRRPLLSGDLETFNQARPKLAAQRFPFRAYLGAPLLAGGQLIGTLEIASYTAERYHPGDLALFGAIAGQAAIAIQNAQRYARQERHAAELAGIADLTRAVEAAAEPRALYGRLTADIARLLEVEVAGIFAYRPDEDALVGQAPFFGLPDIVVDLHRLPLAGSAAVQGLWHQDDPWSSNAVPAEADVDALGLRQAAETGGYQTLALMPIALGGRRLGLLLVANKRNGAPLSEQDLRLLRLFTGQVAAVLDNARLVSEARARAEREEGLRGIVAAMAAGTDLDDILRQAMRRAAGLLGFDIGMVALLDEARAELVPHPASVYGGPPEEAEAARLRADDPLFASSVTRLRRPFISGRAQRDRRLSGLYRTLIEHYQVQSVMDAPLVAGDRALGEVMVAARRERAFHRGDLQLLTTIAAQLASAIDRARLYTATDQSLQRRVEQLTALTRVGRELNQTLEPERILRLVYEEARHAARADCGTIVLLSSEAPGHAALRLGEENETGGDRLTALEQDTVESERLQRVMDLPEGSPLIPHAGVRAAMVVPIVVQGQVVGLIHLHRRSRQGFDDAAAETVAALAAQAAVAVGNAQRYEDQLRRAEQLRRRVDQLAQLFQISRTVRSDRPLEQNLEAVAVGLQEAVGYSAILISALDPHTRRLRRVAAAGIPLARFAALQQVEQPWQKLTPLLQEEFRLSRSYFVPHERGRDLAASLELYHRPRPPADAQAPAEGAWHPDDLLVTPLWAAAGEPVGLLTASDPRDGRRPDRNLIEVVEIFANQAALAIENTRLYQATQSRVARLLSLHRVVERASRLSDRSQVWQVVAEALLEEMPFDLCLIGLMEGERPTLRGRAGPYRPDVDFAPLLRPAPPADDGTRPGPALVFNVRDGGWAQDPLVIATEATSFVQVPIVSQGQHTGLLFVGSRQTPTPFAEEDLELFVILANQLGGELESARLSADIRQRAAQLAALANASQTITASLRPEDVVRAVLEHLSAIVPYDSVTLWLREADQLRIAAAQGFENDAERIGLTVEIADSVLFSEMAKTQSAIRVPDVRADPRFPAGSLSPTRSWLGAPLISKGQIIGAFALDKAEAHFYTAQAGQVLVAFANQAAVALDNARLFEESEQRAWALDAQTQLLAGLNRFSAQLSSTLEVEVILRLVLTEVMSSLSVEHGLAVLFEPDGRSELLLEFPETAETLYDPTNPALLRVRESLAPLAVEDVAQDAAMALARGRLLALGVKSLLALPLVVANTPVAALLLYESTASRHFSAEEVELVQTLANQAAVAVENARIAQELEARVTARTRELQRERERVQTLLQVTTELSSSLDLDRVLTRALQLVTEAVGAVQGSIFLVDLATNQLIYRAALGRPRPLAPGGEPAPIQRGEGLVGWVIKNRQAVVTGNLDTDERWKQMPEHEGRHKSAVAVPLMSNEDALGAMVLLSQRYDAFDDDQLRLVNAAANQVGAAINNAELYRLIRDQAERLGGMLRGQQVEATKSRAILEAIADGVLVADDQGEVILFNAAAERLLGLRREQIMGRPLQDFVGIYGKVGRALIETMAQWRGDPTEYQAGQFLSERLELDDERVVSINLAPVVAGEEYLGAVSVIRDITRDIEVDRLKSEFVTNVSHELRTPMTSIKGYVDVLLLGAAGPVNANQARFLEVIKSNADRLSLLLNDLLDISRIESGRVDLMMRAVDIAPVVTEVMDTLRGRMDEEAKVMNLVTEIPPGLSAVWGDRQRLTQVLMNLADNAFSYTPAGGTIRVRARLDAEQQEVVVEVSDSGVGISPEDQPRLFDRFYRGEDSLVLASSGTGLGLPIARQLIEAQGGRIWLAASEPGQGSTFAVALPLARQAQAAQV